MEESLSEYADDDQHQWKTYLHLVLMAYRYTVHTVTKFSPSYMVLGTPLRLPIDCMYEAPHTELFQTPSDSIFNKMRETQRAHHLRGAEMEVEQTRQKTQTEYHAYGPTYS